MPETYDRLASYARKTAHMQSIGALIGWDQETYMPPAASGARAEQSGLLAELVHTRRTSAEYGELLESAEADSAVGADDRLRASVREMRRDREKAMKLPKELVVELAETGSRAQDVWKDARAKSDFGAFAPMLEKMVGLTRQKAECLRTSEHPELYDALLDEYEPGATGAEIASLFTPLAKELADLLVELHKGASPDTGIVRCAVPASQQQALGELVIEALGFDRSAGRLDVTTHPFCSGVAPGDTRLTTRYDDEGFTEALYGTMHECGHGLYEQGLPKAERFGEPLAEDAGLGIHESQSRLWENLVGRSAAFWEWALPHARRLYAPVLDDATVETMYRAVNTAEPSLIRVGADEATYNAHVFVRFEIERAMFNGGLGVRDLPGEWASGYKRYLGIDVPDDRRGVLQDVHWSFGLIGYFPTYTLGNLYACQFWETIREATPDVDDRMRRGEFGAILAWLRENIHAHGRRYRAAELCLRATGKALDYQPLLRHLRSRLAPVYGV